MKEAAIKTYLLERLEKASKEFQRTRRVSPCTKDYMHGKLTEAREALIGIYGDAIREEIERAEGN